MKELEFYLDFMVKLVFIFDGDHNRRKKMHEKLTAIFQKSPFGYIGFVQELPDREHFKEALGTITV